MDRAVCFFAKPTTKLRQLEDKLYEDPTAIMDADEIWREIFTYLVEECEAFIVYDVEDVTDEDVNVAIHIQRFEVDGAVYMLNESEKSGGKADLFSTVVLNHLRNHFSDDELNEQLVFETIEETLERFGLTI